MVTNFNCGENEVDFYDSLFHGRVKDHIKMQICNIPETFPETTSIVQYNKPKSIPVDVFCQCKMPWVPMVPQQEQRTYDGRVWTL